MKKLIRGRGRQESFSRSEDSALPHQTHSGAGAFSAEELHRRNKSDEASVTAGIAQQGPVFVLPFLKLQVLSAVTLYGE